jgi:hypothetical protein
MLTPSRPPTVSLAQNAVSAQVSTARGPGALSFQEAAKVVDIASGLARRLRAMDVSAASSYVMSESQTRRRLVAIKAELESRSSLEGFLFKQGHQFKTWRRRWFVLIGSELCYYRSRPELEKALEKASPSASVGGSSEALNQLAEMSPFASLAAGVIDLQNYYVEETAVAKSNYAIRLVSKPLTSSIQNFSSSLYDDSSRRVSSASKSKLKSVTSTWKEYLIYAESEQDYKQWITNIRSVIRAFDDLNDEIMKLGAIN